MCYIIYCVDMWYIWSLKSDIIRKMCQLSHEDSFWLFRSLTSAKRRLYVFDKVLCWLWVHSITKNLLKKPKWVSCFTNISYIFLRDLTSEKIRHLVLANYCVDLGQFWSLTSFIIRKIVLSVLLRFVWVVSQLDYLKIIHFTLAN